MSLFFCLYVQNMSLCLYVLIFLSLCPKYVFMSKPYVFLSKISLFVNSMSLCLKSILFVSHLL